LFVGIAAFHGNQHPPAREKPILATDDVARFELPGLARRHSPKQAEQAGANSLGGDRSPGIGALVEESDIHTVALAHWLASTPERGVQRSARR